MATSTIRDAAKAYDGVAKFYDSWYDETRDTRIAHENVALRRLLLRECDGRKVLDLGCGTGFLLDLLPEIHAMMYVGLDVSEQMIERARDKHPDFYFDVLPMEKLAPIYPGSFRVVVSTFAFYYSTDPESTLSGIHRVLTRDGGRLVLVLATELRLKDVDYIPVEVERRAWTAPEIAWKLVEHGFREVEVKSLPPWDKPWNRHRARYLYVTATRA